MHPCLNLTEIQAVIFGHLLKPDLQVDGDPLPDFATLASVARTCTAFTEVALDALWRDQTSLAPLLQVMPADLWMLTLRTEEASTGEVARPKILTFVRDLQEADCSRFDYYAPKIRRLLASRSSEPVYPDETVFHSLRSYRPSHPLLPNLATLRIDIMHPKHIKRMPLTLLSPTITTLNIFVRDPPPYEVPAFLSDAARTCPNIRDFRFSVSNPEVMDTLALNEALTALVSVMHNVEVFDIHNRVPTTPDVIWQLGNFAALRCCETISLPSGLSGSEIQRLFSAGQGRFSKLRHLMFTAPDLDTAANVIAALQCPLNYLDTSVGKQVLQPHFALARFMASFERHRCVSSLTTLWIYGSRKIDGPSDSIRGAFRSLFSLAALESLYLNLSCTSELDDDWLAGAAAAWPRLRELAICHSNPPKITLAGLIPLIRNCSRLSDLWFSIAARPFDSDLLLPGFCNTRITSLFLHKSTIVSPVGVFRCLVLMFPKLKTIDVVEGEGREGWARVSSLLKESMEDEDEG
ncbi:hypothetical protein LshimejAT787_1602960 [Lyophyllum shimeji]|uniref:F-box domain-containing protein n=1 Tax=Lyophyllum shimeji TaxID=47721 RepID=A0A9P3UVQ0_LYOSH|nr:hypothetical protein LshimejAT787_1602960 [Lyophyllum shimeji]